MNFANRSLAQSLLGNTRAEIGQRMIKMEQDQGHSIVQEAAWLDWNDWDRHSIFAQHSRRIRLVALQAKQPGTGAFARLVKSILDHGLIPVMVEPNQLLIDWANRHDWRHRVIGKGPSRHNVWYPRHCLY